MAAVNSIYQSVDPRPASQSAASRWRWVTPVIPHSTRPSGAGVAPRPGLGDRRWSSAEARLRSSELAARGGTVGGRCCGSRMGRWDLTTPDEKPRGLPGVSPYAADLTLRPFLAAAASANALRRFWPRPMLLASSERAAA